MNRLLLFILILITATTVSAEPKNDIKARSFGSYIDKNEFLTKKVESNKSSIIFGGDVMLARQVERLINIHGSSYPWIRLEIDSSDSYLIANFEAAIPKIHVPTQDFKYAFSVASSSLNYLTTFGFTHFSLANNHSLDFREEGFQNTKSVLTANNIETFGNQNEVTNESLTYLYVDDIKVAVIALNVINKNLDVSELDNLFDEADKNSNQQFVFVHWGQEYELIHDKSQEKLAQQLINLGADLIVGHHPHVVQDVGLIDGVPVFYSLGNFVFDQYFDSDVKQGLLIKLSNIKNSLQIDLLPITSEDLISSPRFMNENEKEKFLKNLAKKSSTELYLQLESGTISI